MSRNHQAEKLKTWSSFCWNTFLVVSYLTSVRLVEAWARMQEGISLTRWLTFCHTCKVRMWFIETLNLRISLWMTKSILKWLTLVLQPTRKSTSLSPTEELWLTWHQKLKKENSTMAVRLTCFQLVSFFSLLFKEFSHSKKPRKMNTSTICFSIISSIPTGRKLEETIFQMSSRTLFSKCSPTTETKDQLFLNLRSIHGSKSHSQSNWQGQQSWINWMRRDLRRRLMLPRIWMKRITEERIWKSS